MVERLLYTWKRSGCQSGTFVKKKKKRGSDKSKKKYGNNEIMINICILLQKKVWQTHVKLI